MPEGLVALLDDLAKCTDEIESGAVGTSSSSSMEIFEDAGEYMAESKSKSDDTTDDDDEDFVTEKTKKMKKEFVAATSSSSSSSSLSLSSSSSSSSALVDKQPITEEKDASFFLLKSESEVMELHSVPYDLQDNEVEQKLTYQQIQPNSEVEMCDSKASPFYFKASGGPEELTGRRSGRETKKVKRYEEDADALESRNIRRKLQDEKEKFAVVESSDAVPQAPKKKAARKKMADSDPSNSAELVATRKRPSTSKKEKAGLEIEEQLHLSQRQQQQLKQKVKNQRKALESAIIVAETIVSCLKGNLDCCILGKKLICEAGLQLRCPALGIVVMGLYYSRHVRRVDLSRKWKGVHVKLDKMGESASVWAARLGLDEVGQQDLVNNLKDFFTACWKDRGKA